MKTKKAIVLTHEMLDTINAKTCHGLLRYGGRYKILAVIDRKFEGRDAGMVMDGINRDVPIFGSVDQYLDHADEAPDCLVIGVATHGGLLPEDFIPDITQAIMARCTIVNGLHDYLNHHPVIGPLAASQGVDIVDIRLPRAIKDLHFWQGSIYDVHAQILAVLGVDCAVGKRTTSGMIHDMCNQKGIKTEMIYTGQTGWMQGYKHGFIFDSTLNDFLSGEIEHAVVTCDQVEQPDLIILEGQSSLRNPSGPGGSEFLLSGNAKGVILQIAPEREFFDGYSHLKAFLPSAREEIELIQQYGSEVLAITVYNQHLDFTSLDSYVKQLEAELQMPVVVPLRDGVEELYDVIHRYTHDD